ncbi:MAG: diguanylate cyclase [Thiovulaceae bacterium]|nr:diguanylate cyclase [Sulfurimonadaceae bacterium]
MNSLVPDFNISSHNIFLEMLPIPFFLIKCGVNKIFSRENVFLSTVLKRDFLYLERHLFCDNTLGNELSNIFLECYTTEFPEKLEIVLYDDELNLKTLCMTLSKFMFGDINMIFVNVIDISAYEKLQSHSSKLISEVKDLEHELRSSKLLIDKYIPISSTDLDGTIIECNEAFCNLTGYDKGELIGKKHNLLKDQETVPFVYEDFWKVITNNQTYIGELKNRKKDGSTFWVKTRVHPKYAKDGTKIGYIALREDITNRKNLEEEVFVDSLTKVFKRDKFNDFLAKEIAEFHRYSKVSSLILCDIDHFKNVNDKYGHLVGDEILIDVTNEIKNSLRESDVLARWGGEEFVILLPNTSEKNALNVANKIVKNIAKKRFDTVGKITLSCGVSEVSPKDTLNIWFKRVDDALYQAKDSGRNRAVYR